PAIRGAAAPMHRVAGYRRVVTGRTFDQVLPLVDRAMRPGQGALGSLAFCGLVRGGQGGDLPGEAGAREGISRRQVKSKGKPSPFREARSNNPNSQQI